MKRLAAAVFVLAALLAAVLGLRLHKPVVRSLRAHRAPRIQLYLPPPQDGGRFAETALVQLATDHLEAAAGTMVQPWDGRETAPEPLAVWVRLNFRRHGSLLSLVLESAPSAQGPWQTKSLPAGPPAEVFRAMTQALLPREPPPRPGLLCPETPDTFWELVESMGRVELRSEHEEGLRLARSVVARVPDCASAHVNLAQHLFGRMLWNLGRGPGALDEAVTAAHHADALLPGHPRNTRDLAVMLSDSSRHREALALLETALDRRPGVPRLYEALAYTARTAGLLELSSRALTAQARLTPRPTQVVETTFLYRLEWERFTASCRLEGRPRDTKVRFYLGYVDLVHGRRAQALVHFRASAAVPEGWYGFEDLSEVYALHLEDRRDEALARLQALDQTRVGLSIPDGEITFKLAEAYAVLGETDTALDLAQRAYNQGFGCATWYERSPFLAPVRNLPRFQALLHHMRARQALLEKRFPPSRFGL